MDDKLIMGWIISGMAFVLTMLLFGSGAVWQRYLYYKKCAESMVKTINAMTKAAVEKEKRITGLKGEVKELTQLILLKDEELNELEKKYSGHLVVQYAEILKPAGSYFRPFSGEQDTPEWYKAEYLKLIQEINNDKMLIKLAEQANARLVADNKLLNEERHRLAEKIEVLRDEYTAYKDEAIGTPGTMPVFGQVSEPIEVEPEDVDFTSEPPAASEIASEGFCQESGDSGQGSVS